MLNHLIDPDPTPDADRRADRAAFIEAKLRDCSVLQSSGIDCWDEDSDYLSLAIVWDGTCEGLHDRLCELLTYIEDHLL